MNYGVNFIPETSACGNTHTNVKRKWFLFFGKTHLSGYYYKIFVVKYNKKKITKCNEKYTSMNYTSFIAGAMHFLCLYTKVIASSTRQHPDDDLVSNP